MTRNQLKMLAAFAMFLDHLGAEIFPQFIIFRIIGRLSFPIFSFSIYEGAKYTRDKGRYILRVLFLGVSCMLGYYLYSHEIYGNVLITFSLSLLILYSIKYLKDSWDKKLNALVTGYLLVCASVTAACVLCNVIYIDYGFIGVLLPAFAEIFDTHTFSERKEGKWIVLFGYAVGLLLLAIQMGDIQYYAMLSLPLLAARNKGYIKEKMKYFFYIFYPVHLMLIGGISTILAYI